MRVRQVLGVVLVIAVLMSPQGAVGEEQPLWEAGAGAALLYMPDYRGSDEKRFWLLPYPYLIYRGDVLRVDKERISGRIFRTDRVLLDFSLSGNVPVDSSKNDARRDMPDLDPTFEIGPSLSITLLENRQAPYKWSLTLPFRAVYSTNLSRLHHEGWVFHPRLVFEKADLIPDSGLNLGISAGPIFADSTYHRYFYAVDRAYATASRPFYDAPGGYSGSTLSVGLNKKWDPLIFNVFVSVDFLQGAVFEDSPLVKTKTSFMTGFTVSWVFLKSEKKVPAGR
jgi:MipA family protein